MNFKALVVDEHDGVFVREIKKCSLEDLPADEVLIRVHYSSLNYKDALSATGNKGVTKKYPHTPGIDAAGLVVESQNAGFQPGDKVIVTGYDLGMNTSGGFGQYIRVPGEWVIKLPSALTLKEAMIIGTAGFTAGISVRRLSQLVQPDDGKVLVTGATGGVGSVALSLLHQLGYNVAAVSGKQEETEFLMKLGASEVISRVEFSSPITRPMLSATYAGAVDTVGGPVLENVLKSIHPFGAVTTCGSVASTQLNMTVFPFILRGITLIGISAQNYPMPQRTSLWQLMSELWKPQSLMDIYNEITLDELNGAIDKILEGKLKGRTVVNLL